MKNHYSFLLLFPIFGFSQHVFLVDVKTNEVGYSAYSNRVYVTIPSSNGPNGNSIGKINPLTHLLEDTYPFGSEPKVLDISEDGQVLYAGFTGSATVRKFDITTHTASIAFPIGGDASGSYYAEDIEIMPGNPNTVAVARRNTTSFPRAEGVAVFDNGIIRSNATPDQIGSNQIEFGAQNTIVGYDNESVQHGFREMAVDPNGVAITSMTPALTVPPVGELRFSTYNNRAYFSNGGVLDFSGTPFLVGSIPNIKGPGRYDPFTNLVCYASYDQNGTITLKRFNPNTLLFVDSVNITETSGETRSIDVCGNGCYVFNTANKVIFVNEFYLKTDTFDRRDSVAIYPNPASEKLTIETHSDMVLDSLEMWNMLGQSIRKELIPNQNNFSIDINHLPTGTYFLSLHSDQGLILKKFIKL